jgi:hypothetical protein
MSAGIGGSGYKNKLWTITDLDRSEDIVGQFIGQNVTKNVSGNIARGSSYNSQFPIIQWVAGEIESISFTAKLFAHDSTDFSVDDRLERLEQLVKRNNDLKRPPVCAFTLGDVPSLSVDCLVRSLGGTYDEVRNDGTLRGVTLQINLERYVDVEFAATDPTVPESFTRIRRAKKGDTYEDIALNEYGDPELGILLRQFNPRIPGMDLSELKARDPVHIFPEEYLVTFDIEPEFHGFGRGSDNEAAEQRRRELFDDRDDDSYTTIFANSVNEDFM